MCVRVLLAWGWIEYRYRGGRCQIWVSSVSRYKGLGALLPQLRLSTANVVQRLVVGVGVINECLVAVSRCFRFSQARRIQLTVDQTRQDWRAVVNLSADISY